MIRIPIILISILWSLALSANQDLPSFGDSTSGIISLDQERRLGQQFLRSIRAQAPTLDDPILQDFLEHLIYRLASHSQLEDRRLDIVIIRNGSLNAFAAPGGIVGVHDGLFRYAQTEHEMSAILSHELAHLSQRHFARRVAEGKKSAALNIAGLLAGVILAATAGGDAALLALTGSQGLAQNQSLKYSREREAEADRIGIYTLDEASMDPRAMAYMFERLQRASRYSTGNNIPEFLRTHPVTNDRVADSYNQTQNYPKKQFPASLDYQLMRIRARAITSGNQSQEVKHFEAAFKESSNTTQKTANQYGLVISLTNSLAFDKARTHIRGLREQHPLNIPFRIAEAEIYTRAQQPEIALELLEEALEVSPNNYPLSATYAQTLLAASKPVAALKVLAALSVRRPNDEYVWYLLAEAYGLANNIPGVHEARAEFFVLNANYDQAIKQLGYALPLVRHNFQQTARIKQRLEDIWMMKDGG
jgi:predicted Zn-dependent protease|tara:strand:- start:107 stop:1537 length:1431 start_codon:yes stop_codon:yes gene_type:complete